MFHRRLKTLILALTLLIVFGVGCVPTRTIFVRDGTPVRLRVTIPAVKVWVADAQGTWVEGVMDLQAGWWCLPDPGPEK